MQSPTHAQTHTETQKPLHTQHLIEFGSSTSMSVLGAETVELVVTSPPYPMIDMWDDAFRAGNEQLAAALDAGEGQTAFELMHQELDKVWAECARVLRPGAFLCINIGDATRTVGKNFRLYSNHARITSSCVTLGFQALPLILWRKQTNAPNKFMGSGMLPAGAYITLEHEYILVFRKGGKRAFGPEDAVRRRHSAFFWEERNQWFSDIWDFKGARQLLTANDARSRSAAYPFELANRIINMYSMQGDTVLDPFLGTGTSTAAAIVNARNSVGYELLKDLEPFIHESVQAAHKHCRQLVRNRLRAHEQFVTEIEERREKPLGHTNTNYGFRVMTTQETELQLLELEELKQEAAGRYVAVHKPARPADDVNSFELESV